MLTAEVLELGHVNALDVSFGTNGFKIQLAANSEKVHNILIGIFVNECKLNPLHMQVVGVDFNPYFLSKDEDGCVKLSMKEYTNNLTSIKTRADIFSGDGISIREVSFVATLTKVIYYCWYTC